MTIHRSFFSRSFLFGVCCFVALLQHGVSSQQQQLKQQEEALEATQNLIDWIIKEGGIYHSKQSIQPNGGVIANDSIQQGEVLLKVPWDCILGAAQASPERLYMEEELRRKRQRLEEQDEEDEQFDKEPACRVIQAVIEETLHPNSNFAPHLEYLSLTTTNDSLLPQIPAVWSQEGRDLLEDLNDHGALPPFHLFGLMNHDWFGACVSNDNSLQKRVAATVAAHGHLGDLGILVPLVDNRHYRPVASDAFNAFLQVNPGQSVALIASTTIRKGDAIVRSYANGAVVPAPTLFLGHGLVDVQFYPKLYEFQIEVDEEYIQFAIEVFQTTQQQDQFYAHVEIYEDYEEQTDTDDQVERFLAAQLNKLQRIRSVILANTNNDTKTLPKDSTMSIQEWTAAWIYYENLVQAIELGLQSFEPEDGYGSCPGGHYKHNSDSSCPIWDGFPDVPDHEIASEQLELAFDETNPYGPSEHSYSMCNDDTIEEWRGYVPPGDIEVLKSQYQEIRFFHHPSTRDMVMKLDDTVQQCTSYRPHYHEFAVHFPARFLDRVERVLFVGGGDSMVLHEVLKYPSLEKVVGLELDQYVLRNSFRYFNTQPHFDDKRVEWWFGDGAKSLLMLPKDYFQSFDLVVVDLSETVMSFQVTNQLSIFQTLALLLKPDGILLKNGEYYMEKMSEYFDHTLQYFEYSVPFICDQGMVIGSNKIDFFNRTLKDHGVELLVLEPQDTINEQFDEFYRFTEYRKNNARKQGQCEDINYNEGDLPNAGILMVVEVEDVKADLKSISNIETIVLDAMKSIGFAIESTVLNDASNTIIVLAKEGYVTVRLHPEHLYVGLDIQLWANFDLMEVAREALMQSLGGSDEKTSSFRIVTGGMSGSPLLDRSKTGPRMVNSRNCEQNDSPETTVSVDLQESGLIGSLEMVEDDIVAAVICGSETGYCESLNIMKKASKIKRLLPIYTCESMSSNAAIFNPQLASKMAQCEVEVSNALTNNDGEKISLLVIDESANPVMGKVLLSIFTSAWNRKRLFSQRRFVALAFSDAPWRRNLLVKIREKIVYKPMSFVDLLLHHKEEESKLSLLSLYDPQFFLHLKETVNAFDKVHDGAATMAVDKVFDGLAPPQVGHFRPHIFEDDAYDPTPAQEQQATQESLGRQSIVQFEIQRSSSEISLSILENALTTSSFGDTREVEFTLFDGKVSGIGDGLVVVACSPTSHILLSWDGKTHIGANLYSKDINPNEFKRFVVTFTNVLKSNMIYLKMTLSDTHPRGVGKVVSFPAHMN